MQPTRIIQLLRSPSIGSSCEIRGWLKSSRNSKSVSFLDVNDGSCLGNLQVVVDTPLIEQAQMASRLSTGAAVRVIGKIVESPAKGQAIEMHAEHIELYGDSPEDYPLQKKRHSFEFLREISHLRPRTNSIGAVARMRSELSYAIHSFFHQRGFFYVHTPIISTSNCEGAGEMFTVTHFDLQKLSDTKKNFTWADDFFGTKASLTVSGQLEAEAYALALGNVYTFGPTFRAENSNTSRHLAEFWMIEPEMAFCDLDEDIVVAQALLKHLFDHALSQCHEDLLLFDQFIEKGLIEKLQAAATSRLTVMSYTEAIAILEKSKKKFDLPPAWGMDLQSEHERYLAEEVINGPLVLKDYPKTIKPFYMRVNDDEKTVAAMDILLPGIGEIVGGSQREERFEILSQRMHELQMDIDQYQWYLDLRRYGSAPHAGFGLGFERIIQYVTGMKNIREVIAFPRTPGAASF